MLLCPDVVTVHELEKWLLTQADTWFWAAAIADAVLYSYPIVGCGRNNAPASKILFVIIRNIWVPVLNSFPIHSFRSFYIYIIYRANSHCGYVCESVGLSLASRNAFANGLYLIFRLVTSSFWYAVTAMNCVSGKRYVRTYIKNRIITTLK